MKRYIRTKDGRIIDKERVIKGLELVHLEDTPTDYCPCNGWYWKDQDGDYELEVGDDETEREADTIEELCDEAVVKETWRNRPEVIQIGGNSNRFACARDLYLGKPTTESIYGSIWVDGNLMKVAELNEKGELELL